MNATPPPTTEARPPRMSDERLSQIAVRSNMDNCLNSRDAEDLLTEARRARAAEPTEQQRADMAMGEQARLAHGFVASNTLSADDRAALDLGRAAMAAAPETSRDVLARRFFDVFGLYLEDPKEADHDWSRLKEAECEGFRDAAEDMARFVLAALLSNRGIDAAVDRYCGSKASLPGYWKGSAVEMREAIAAAARATLGGDVLSNDDDYISRLTAAKIEAETMWAQFEQEAAALRTELEPMRRVVQAAGALCTEEAMPGASVPVLSRELWRALYFTLTALPNPPPRTPKPPPAPAGPAPNMSAPFTSEFTNGCWVMPYSSNVCEVGTKGCNRKHPRREPLAPVARPHGGHCLGDWCEADRGEPEPHCECHCVGCENEKATKPLGVAAFQPGKHPAATPAADEPCPIGNMALAAMSRDEAPVLERHQAWLHRETERLRAALTEATKVHAEEMAVTENGCEELAVQVAELKQKTLETTLELARRADRHDVDLKALSLRVTALEMKR